MPDGSIIDVTWVTVQKCEPLNGSLAPQREGDSVPVKEQGSWLWVWARCPMFEVMPGARLLAFPQKHKGSDWKLWVCYGKKRMTGRTAVLAPTPWIWEQFSEPVCHMQWVMFALPWLVNSSRGQEAVSALPGQPLRAGRQKVRITSVHEERKSQVWTAALKIQLWLHCLGKGEKGDTRKYLGSLKTLKKNIILF